MAIVVEARPEPRILPVVHPSFAFRGVSLIAVLTGIALTVTASRYDFFGDELYFLSSGRRLNYTFADQGVIVPLFARLADVIAPGSVTALRFSAVVMCMLAIVITALIAYELGGSLRTQLLAAGTYATTSLVATQVQLSTFAFDLTFLAAITWLLIRWVRLRQDWLIIAAGVVAAVDMQVKWMIPLAWGCIGLAVILAGPREILRRPALWVATAIFAASALPDLYWQSQHNWPQLAMGSIIGAEQDATGYGPLGFLPQMAGLAGLLGGLLLLVGFWALFRQKSLRPYRFIAVSLLLMTVLVIVTHGRPYYPTGFFPAMFAAGAVGYSQMEKKRWMRITAIPVVAFSVMTFVAALTLLPAPMTWRTPVHDSIDLGLRSAAFGTTGWDRFVGAVNDGYRTLTPAEQANTVIMTQGYWQAGAVEEFGRKYHLPATYSPSRGFGFFGAPPESATTVIYVGLDDAEHDLRSHFAQVTPLEHVNDPIGIPGIDRMVTVWKAQGPNRPWSVEWNSMTTLYFDLGLWHDPRATSRPVK